MDGTREKFSAGNQLGSDPTLSVPLDLRKDTLVSFEGLLAKLMKDMKELVDMVDEMLEEEPQETKN